MTKITDMLGREVQIGDRIAAAFRYRPSNGTEAELRTGVVVDIFQRRSCQRNGAPEGKVDFLKVRWDASSQDVQAKEGVENLLAERQIRTGQSQDRPAMLDQEYRERTTDIMVDLRRFIRVG